MIREEIIERRVGNRSMRCLLPACIEFGGETTMAVMRDLSNHGAGFEARIELKVGQPLQYSWGTEEPRSGRVIWCHDGRFGIENDIVVEPSNPPTHNYRSVRAPMSAPAEIITEGGRAYGEVVNLAQRGLCMLTSKNIAKGTVATIKLGHRRLEFVTAKWSDGDRIGISFPKPIAVFEMAKIMQGA